MVMWMLHQFYHADIHGQHLPHLVQFVLCS